MMPIHKGDIVTVKAYVFTEYGKPSNILPDYIELVHEPQRGRPKDKKCLWKRKGMLFRALVTGCTYRSTGRYASGNSGGWGFTGYDEPNPSELMVDKRHKVWCVQPIDSGDRYYIPYTCLEKDLEKEIKSE